MLGGSSTLSRYFALRFLRTTLLIFLVCFVLIAVVDYVELAQRWAGDDTFSAGRTFLVSIFRVPQVIERALPFTVLFAAISTFVMANRKLELVVTRAAGLSAWQFLLPATIVALGIGVFATTVFNPFSAMLKERSLEIAASLRASGGGLTQRDQSNGALWLRQSGKDGASIIGAKDSTDQGLTLIDVTAFVFENDGAFRRRIDAGKALYADGSWRFVDATVTEPGKRPEPVAETRLATNLGPREVREAFANPETISFWSLPSLIAIARTTGLPSHQFELQYQTLLAQPLFLLAMVLVAATVSLRFSRSREIGQVIVTGVAIGFVLYVIGEIARDLGGSGVVPATVAAWTPAIIAALMSVTVLLHREDG
ncbi:LPS export ABC transporter permease LptG [Prosthecomicrobium pneumaticum]|uniref:Lipopolysaccharide export system permease protein n=1 Tax=Prosthecomicrobium pneumaticum TaxID=81895 RepID=A0A7W9FKT1_9HYPH|nr:LPS export ABC transporter permease LptG [Prosthecomicrobium pneumaticum]MBB5751483.1 lipopolysaccharide export system permease protein [Prosthecomicrobium pneumaticum]